MIKEIKTEQFAGIQDKKVQFTDGMEILLGKNEAGKSTLLSAMYHALNTPVKIDLHRLPPPSLPSGHQTVT